MRVVGGQGDGALRRKRQELRGGELPLAMEGECCGVTASRALLLLRCQRWQISTPVAIPENTFDFPRSHTCERAMNASHNEFRTNSLHTGRKPSGADIVACVLRTLRRLKSLPTKAEELVSQNRCRKRVKRSQHIGWKVSGLKQ